MKVVLALLLLLGLAGVQSQNPFAFSSSHFSPNQQQTFNNQRASRDRNVHATDNGRQYHYSWKADKERVFTGEAALSYCQGLGRGWAAIGIGSQQEWQFIRKLLSGIPQMYFWTGGYNNGGGWSWATGERFGYTAWSRTGGSLVPQPDNRDPPEKCLGVLKHVYKGDGISWHDINCKHAKHVVCEKI